MRKYPSVLLSALVLLSSVSHPVFANDIEAGPGEAVYVMHAPTIGALWFKKKFLFVLQGPASTGYSFNDMIGHKIMIAPHTQDEEFEIVDKDQVQIKFAVHFTVHPEPTRIRELVEDYQGANWYNAIAQPALRTFVRDAIGGQDGNTLSTSQDVIEQKIRARVDKWLAEKKYPFIVDAINVGNFQYPSVISEAAAQKQANIQRLQAMNSAVEIARKEGEKKVVEAEAIRKAQDIIASSLTPMYIQHEFVKALEQMSNKAGNQVIYIPVGANGLPIVSDVKVPINKP